MAILHRKEEKIQVVLGRLPKQYGHEQFVEMFIKLYSKDWGKIKSAYIKQSQDKEPGTVVNMPKPELYLKQLLETYLANRPAEEVSPTKAKATPKKKAEVVVEEAPVKKTKVVTKKKAETEPIKEVKAKAAPKKKIAEEKLAPAKVKKA
ncbi:hypothetical protein [Pedobacter sp.]|uniref:hypothetical protein n=1 Tax=Pedobacter sp. TaxID=1411316 RepID=UPI0031D47D92